MCHVTDNLTASVLCHVTDNLTARVLCHVTDNLTVSVLCHVTDNLTASGGMPRDAPLLKLCSCCLLIIPIVGKMPDCFRTEVAPFTTIPNLKARLNFIFEL